MEPLLKHTSLIRTLEKVQPSYSVYYMKGIVYTMVYTGQVAIFDLSKALILCVALLSSLFSVVALFEFNLIGQTKKSSIIISLPWV